MGNLSSCFGRLSTISRADVADPPANGVSPRTEQASDMTPASAATTNLEPRGSNGSDLRLDNATHIDAEAKQGENNRKMSSCRESSGFSSDAHRKHGHQTFAADREKSLEVGMSGEVFSHTRAKIFAKLEARLPRYYEALQQFLYVRMLLDPVPSRAEGVSGEVFSRNRAKLFGKLEPARPRYGEAVLQFQYVNMLPDPLPVKTDIVQERIQEFEELSSRQVKGRIRPEEELEEKSQHAVGSFGSSVTSFGPTLISPRDISDMKL